MTRADGKGTTLRKRRLKFLLRKRPKPSGPLPEPGELEGKLMPKEQRPQGQMFWRTRKEIFGYHGYSRKQPIIWGDYNFDNLFRMGLGMLIGSFATGIGAAGADYEGSMALLTFLVVIPPIAALFWLAQRWKRKNIIRKHLFIRGFAFGAIHGLIVFAITRL